MHIAIDLGEFHTYLACWESEQKVGDACIKVSIPGVAVFNSGSSLNPWAAENMGDYFSHLQREYLLPSRRIVESAALAVPGIFSLNLRGELLEVAEEILGLEQPQIIPQPLALVAGYNLRNRSQPLQGDILVIQAQESHLDFTILSISAASGIVLEKQFSAAISRAGRELEVIGGCNAAGRGLDYVLVSAPQKMSPELVGQLEDLSVETIVINLPDLAFAAVEGLYGALIYKTWAPSNRLSLIYPYEFYLESKVSTLGSPCLQRIPFDTANLELACDGVYRLTSLDNRFNHLDLDSQRISFRIYELPIGCPPGPDIMLAGYQPVLDIDSPREDLPPQLVIILDMAAARLNLELESEHTVTSSRGTEVFRLHLAANQERLLHLLRSQGLQLDLVSDWETYRHAHRTQNPDLTQQVHGTLFVLHALTHLWIDDSLI